MAKVTITVEDVLIDGEWKVEYTINYNTPEDAPPTAAERDAEAIFDSIEDSVNSREVVDADDFDDECDFCQGYCAASLGGY